MPKAFDKVGTVFFFIKLVTKWVTNKDSYVLGSTNTPTRFYCEQKIESTNYWNFRLFGSTHWCWWWCWNKYSCVFLRLFYTKLPAHKFYSVQRSSGWSSSFASWSLSSSSLSSSSSAFSSSVSSSSSHHCPPSSLSSSPPPLSLSLSSSPVLFQPVVMTLNFHHWTNISQATNKKKGKGIPAICLTKSAVHFKDTIGFVFFCWAQSCDFNMHFCINALIALLIKWPQELNQSGGLVFIQPWPPIRDAELGLISSTSGTKQY